MTIINFLNRNPNYGNGDDAADADDDVNNGQTEYHIHTPDRR